MAQYPVWFRHGQTEFTPCCLRNRHSHWHSANQSRGYESRKRGGRRPLRSPTSEGTCGALALLGNEDRPRAIVLCARRRSKIAYHPRPVRQAMRPSPIPGQLSLAHKHRTLGSDECGTPTLRLTPTIPAPADLHLSRLVEWVIDEWHGFVAFG